MRTLIVNASSKSKKGYTDDTFEYPSNTFLSQINEEYRDEILSTRKTITKIYGIESGPDLVGDMVAPDDTEFQPAYIRYIGRTYSRISDEAWTNLINSGDKFDMVILSAVYGLMRYNEPVRNYSIQQNNKVEGTKISTYWKNSGAKDWLMNYITQNKFDRVVFVLSTSYAAIVQRDKLIEELNEMGIIAEDKQLKSAGRVSMLERGSYIDALLLNKLE